MSFLRAIPICIGIYSLPALAHAQFSQEVQKIHSLHEQGVGGEEDAVIDCITLAEKLLKRNPQDQMVRVFLGSAYTLRSRDLMPGPEKLRTLKYGGQLMDEAVEAAREDPQVRLIRAINNSQLPRIFGRRSMALADFDWIVAWVEQNPLSLDTDEKQAMYYFAGLAFSANGDKKSGKELWKKGTALSPGSDLGQKMLR